MKQKSFKQYHPNVTPEEIWANKSFLGKILPKGKFEESIYLGWIAIQGLYYISAILFLIISKLIYNTIVCKLYGHKWEVHNISENEFNIYVIRICKQCGKRTITQYKEPK